MDVQAHIARITEALPELAAAEIRIVNASEHAALCTQISTAISGLQHLRSRLLAAGQAAEVDVELGATSMGALISKAHGGDRREVEAATRQGEHLADLPLADAAAGTGDLTPKQAALIATTIKGLPEGLSVEKRTECEAHLVQVAGRRSMRGLRIACDRISAKWLTSEREVDIAEGEILKAREARARETAEFSITDQGNGTHKGWFTIPDAQAAMIRRALEGIAAPRRDHLNGFEDRLAYKNRLGQAFMALCDHLPADGLAQSGGMNARIVVTIDFESLTTGLGIAELDTGVRVSASQARIMAANSGVLPAVMGSKSLILDLGRSQRLFSESQRVALAVRDGGCTFGDCDRPPAWCEAHHAARAWAKGGKTDLANATLLCWHHHRHVEQHGWRFHLTPDGTVQWMPPDRTARPEPRHQGDLVLAT